MSEVVIYTRMMCGYCSAAKRLLERRGVDYVEHDATFDRQLRQEMIQKAGGRATFPQIFIDGTHVGGADELHALEAAGRLEAMLSASAQNGEDR